MIFSEEEQLYLEELIGMEHWKVLLKALEIGVDRQRDNVFAADIRENDRAVALAKARYEGAQTLSIFVTNLAKKKRK